MPDPSEPRAWESPALLAGLIVLTVAATVGTVVLHGLNSERIRAAAAPAAPAVAAPVVPVIPPPPPPARPTPVADPSFPVHLCELEPERVVRSPQGGLGRDRAPWGGPLKVRGASVTMGLAMQPPNGGLAVVEYRLDRSYAWFMATAAVAEPRCRGAGSARFRVYVDGERRFESRPMWNGQQADAMVSVMDAHVLRLEVDDAGDGNECDHAVWMNARLVPRSPDAP